MSTPLPRSKVKKNQTWNAESVFASSDEFDIELQNMLDTLPEITKYKGHLGDSVDTFLEAFKAMNALEQRSMKVRVYASLSSAVDANDDKAAAMNGKAMSALAQVGAAVSFVEPELLSVGEAKLRGWLKDDLRMKLYERFVNDLFRKQAHVRSAEVEELMGMLRDPFGAVRTTASQLANADFKFKPARDSDGNKLELTQSTKNSLMHSTDRKARKTAWQNYNDKYLEYKNTLAGNLAASIKQNVFNMKARKFNSALEATLFNGDVPVEMFHNLLGIFQKKLPLWHKYWRIRRKALGVKTLHPYDVWAPLTTKKHKVPFEQAVDWICEGLAPMATNTWTRCARAVSKTAGWTGRRTRANAKARSRRAYPAIPIRSS